VIAEPPLENGAAHETAIEASPATTADTVGAVGTSLVEVVSDTLENAPTPTAFAALILTTYDVWEESPEILYSKGSGGEREATAVVQLDSLAKFALAVA
jgi:hypothetical protein